MYKKLILICFFIALPATGNAVLLGDAYHPPDGTYLVMYQGWFSGDNYVDKNGNSVSKDIDLDLHSFYLRPLYYKGDLLFGSIIPVGRVSSGSVDDSDSGFGDVVLTAGYFLPVKWANVLPVLQLKLPTGNYDKDEIVNFGSGQTDLYLELYLNKFSQKYGIDAAIKHWLRFENDSTEIKPGNETRLETVISYPVTPQFWLGGSASYMFGENYESRGKEVSGSGIEKATFGVEAAYLFTATTYVAATYTKDSNPINTIPIKTFLLRFGFKF